MATTKLYTGGTGCGKTYKAITESKSFVIAVPCRQLAYEIFWDYSQITRIDTGEVHMGDLLGNGVCVYENLPDGPIMQDTLIVDEFHLINDHQRGGALLDKILANKAAGKEIKLLTATDTVSAEVKTLLEISIIELQPFTTPPTKVELDDEDFCAKVKAGMTAIVFTKYLSKESDVSYYAEKFGISEDKIGLVTGQTLSYDRLKTQLDFKAGLLQVVIATNVLAQGLNFPAQGVLIEYNSWDSWADVEQKKGRVARPTFGETVGYFHVSYVEESGDLPHKQQSWGVPEKAEREAVSYYRPSGDRIDIVGWGFMAHEVPSDFYEYKSYRYSYRFLRALSQMTGSLESDEQTALDFMEEQSFKLRGLLSQRPLDNETRLAA
jgi:hypothetical protein